MLEESDGRDMPLSQMSDAYTSNLCFPCPVVVKRHGGNAEEAELQLMVWQASALARLEHLRNHGREPHKPIPPVVGCTAVGHTWSFYIAWRDHCHVTLMGPFNPGNAGTADVLSTYVLTSLWKKIFN
jgi:hypothetical protein